MNSYLNKEHSSSAMQTRICPLWRLKKSVQCNHRYDSIRGLAQHLSRVHCKRINHNRIPLKQLRETQMVAGEIRKGKLGGREMSETPMNKLRELCEKLQALSWDDSGLCTNPDVDECAEELRAILPEVERLA